MKKVLKKLSDLILAFWILLYVIFEELVWDLVAKPIYQYLRGLKLLYAVEIKVKSLEPLTLLILFLVLFFLVEGLGILALSLIAQGNPLVGIALYIAKLPIAAFTFWLFRVSKEILMAFAWFKYSYERLDYFIDVIKASQFHQRIVATVNRFKVWVKAQLGGIKQRLGIAVETLKKSMRALQ
ncbi:MAG: hypothetical protein Q7U98_09180 [Methylicorpusculum sp.]|uniref:hypothetical protein n=1 Tax=Methylicorpusculum sp. TaxID=2713644 RepID=UPI002721470E|nr:hypothetical protein [Methylicorpusculum sp.]MDO8845874.1 hypothetical protein [Methylicorpusculum sp.]MDO8939321.1 hypothetical protein [Methylicorpusculum sp.]MDP2201681.1 hypothetical protein [Methylicorpusculum sp.]